MPRARANSIDIEYEETGSPTDPALLLVAGFSVQLTVWPESFKRGIADLGQRVIAFDNRDIGLSTEFAHLAPPSPRDILQALAEGRRADAPYLLDDMAADAIGVMDALGVEQADVVGISMGGMIAQLMALNYPERVRSLIPIMTTSGDPSLPPGAPEALAALTEVPERRTPEAIAETAVKARRAIGSHPDIRTPDEEVRARAIAGFHRSYRPMGVARQYSAILAQPRWHERLGSITQPTLVLHGAADPLLRAAGGRDIAARIPGAEIEIYEKWGHDLPEPMMPLLVERIGAFLGKSSRS